MKRSRACRTDWEIGEKERRWCRGGESDNVVPKWRYASARQAKIDTLGIRYLCRGRTGVATVQDGKVNRDGRRPRRAKDAAAIRPRARASNSTTTVRHLAKARVRARRQFICARSVLSLFLAESLLSRSVAEKQKDDLQCSKFCYYIFFGNGSGGGW